MGGWGTNCSGDNPGCYLTANFDGAFPSGAVIGCASGESMTFTNAQSVIDFLACGGTQAVLIDTETDPSCTDNVFAGQLLAAQLNVTFDDTYADFGESDLALRDMVFTDLDYQGYTVGAFVEEANLVIGSCLAGDLDFYVIGLTTINEEYIDGTPGNGELIHPNCDPTLCSCTIYCPNDVELGCLGDTSVVANGSPTVSGDCCLATDAAGCDVEITWTYSDSEVNADCISSFVRTFTGVITVSAGIDWTGNDETIYCHQTFTLTDTDPPTVTITCPADDTVYSDEHCNADAHPSTTGYATAAIEDVCDPNPTLDPLTYTDHDTVYTAGATAGCFSFIRTWTASGSDWCDLTDNATCDQTIYVVDNTPPTIDLHCPAPSTVYVDEHCNADLSGVDDATADFDDNCILGATALTHSDAVTSTTSDGCYTITRTWTATASDACGNHAAEATCDQIIYVADNTPPTIDLHCPAPSTVYVDEHCNADLSGVDDATADFDDNCILGATALTHSDAVTSTTSDGCYTITRTWTATASDACGNHAAEATCDQIIYVADNTPPTIDLHCPAPSTVYVDEHCNADLSGVDDATADFDDNCILGATALTHSDAVTSTTSDGCYTITRTWTATASDACGNHAAEATCDQIIYVADNTPPTIDLHCPAPSTVYVDEHCNADLSGVDDATADFDDNCILGATALTHSDAVTSTTSDGCYTITRTWTATASDACGNHAAEATCDQIIYVADNTPPTIDLHCPAPSTVYVDEHCNADLSGVDDATADFDDNCILGATALTHSDAVTSTTSDGCYTITRTWTATASDACGNHAAEATCDQIIYVADNTPPTIDLHCPAPSTVYVDEHCNADLSGVDDATADFDDNCILGATALTHSDAVTSTTSDGCYTITRTWTATASDACGNHAAEATCDQIIYVADNTPPTIIVSDTAFCEPEIPCHPQLRTQTIGGWGNNCSGNNPGCYLHANFDETFPDGLTIGCNAGETLLFTSAQAITDFLPCGGPAASLNNSATDPSCISNALAGQLLATALNVGFDDKFEDFGEASQSLRNLVFTNPAYAGYNVGSFLDEAHAALGGCSPEALGFFVSGLTIINEEYVDGTTNNEGLRDPDCNLNCTTWTFENWIELVGTPTASDNCDSDVTTTLTSVQHLDTTCVSACILTWTATDHCGNTTTAHQMATVDTYAPEITADDMTAECGPDYSAWTHAEWEAYGSATALDNCVDILVPSVTGVSFHTDGCYGFYVLTWSATDECNNTGTAHQMIDIIDTHAPTVTTADDTAECGPDYGTWSHSDWQDYGSASATDNCADVTAHVTHVAYHEDDCYGFYILTWSATDECDNTGTAHQTIDIIDTHAPTVTTADDTAECGPDYGTWSHSDWQDYGSASATDNCADVTAHVTHVAYHEDDCYGFYILTWSATDECDNTGTAHQTIDIIDTHAPTVTTADDTAECGPDYGSWSHSDWQDYGSASATDNCADVTAHVTHVAYHEDDCYGFYILTWSATDECDNTGTAHQTIDIIDTHAPTVTTADDTAECGPDYGTWSHSDWQDYGSASATDNCADVTAHVTHVAYHEDDCYGFYILTWSATDECDNTGTAHQTIDIIDTHAPTVTTADDTAECGPDYGTWSHSDWQDYGSASATDNCADVTAHVTHVAYHEDDCYGFYILTWSATDECDNTGTAHQTIDIIDTHAPTVTTADDTAECGPDYGTWSHSDWQDYGSASATDNCADVTAHVTHVAYHEDDCYGFYILTWSATDECDNTGTAHQTIDIIDTHAPTVTTADDTAECGPDYGTWSHSDWQDYGSASATDNCADVTAHVTHVAYHEDDCYGFYILTWSATDECDNTGTAHQTIDIIDTHAPTVTTADDTAECGPDYGTWSHSDWQDYGSASATDNCADVTAHVTHVAYHEDDCYGFYILTWSATDECDNTGTAHQTIDIIDTHAPTVTTADDTAECGPDYGTWSHSDWQDYGSASATDNCADVTAHVTHVAYHEDDCYGFYILTWSATDECDNTGTAHQTIDIIDTHAPTVTTADDTAECGPDYGTWSHSDWQDYGSASATDNCADVTAHVTHVAYHEDDCYGFYILTWSATDECDNTGTAHQTIDIIDTHAPTVTTADDTAECGPDYGTWSHSDWQDYGSASATDNCADVTAHVTHVAYHEDDCYGFYILTWSATDECDNTGTAHQTIDIIDTHAPTIHADDTSFECEPGNNFYPDLTLEEWAALVVATASDNCDHDVHPELQSVTMTSDTCTNTYVLTWYAEDECGNPATAHQTVDVTDDEAPVLALTCLGHLTLESDENCHVDVPMDPPTYTVEDCDTAVDIHISGPVETLINDLTYSDDDTHEGCYTIVQEWTVTATDWCGLSTTASCERTIDVVDLTPPTIAGDTLITISCEMWAAYEDSTLATASDNCDSHVTLTMTQDMVSGTCPFSVLRNYHAVDDCGNETHFIQIINVVDETAPVVTITCPDDIELTSGEGCVADISEDATGMATAEISDNCDPDAAITSIDFIDGALTYSDLADDDTPEGCYSFDRMWIAQGEDWCSNENADTCVQQITVLDITAPVFNSHPESLTLDCGDNYDVALPVASDNCDSDVNQSCSNEIVYTLDGCSTCYVDTWTCTANDDCGNSTTISWSYTITDDNAPELFVTCPDDVILYSDANCHVDLPVDVPNYGVTDCDPNVEVTVDGPVETLTDDLTYSDDDNHEGCYSILQEWTITATDCKGNETVETCARTITVMDNIAPEFNSHPESLTLDCGDNYDVALPVASDNCDSEVEQSCSNEIVYTLDGCSTCYVDTWTCTANDDCGNSTTISWSYTVTDDNAPELFVICPDDVVLYSDASCHVDLPVDVPNYGVTDCDPNVEVTIDGPVETLTDDLTYSDDDNHEGCYSILQEWTITATDCKGNETVETCARTITVMDNIAPVFNSTPSDAIYGCDDAWDVGLPVAEDNCDSEVEQNCETEMVYTLGEDCPYNYTQTWTCTANDDCGNSTSISWTITIVDDAPPTCFPEEITVCCPTEVPAPEAPIALDTCDPAPEVMLMGADTVWNVDCPTQGVITRYWSAMDCTGNTSMCTQTINISDTETPEFTYTCGFSDGEVVEICCETATEQDYLSYSCDMLWDDNCPDHVIYSYESNLNFGEGDGESCTASTPDALADGETCTGFIPHALRLFNLPSSDKFFGLNAPGTISFMGDTAWTYTASFYVIDESDGSLSTDDGFAIDVMFHQGLDWDNWSNQGFPTGYKADCPVTSNAYEDWMYYILESGTITGLGAYDGSAFTLTHQPQNLFYGCQVGVGANNMNDNNGFSSWMLLNGTYVHYGQEMSFIGSGDIFGDIDCCADGSFTQTVTLTDCGCNTNSITWDVIGTTNGCDVIAEQEGGNTEEVDVSIIGGGADPIEDKFPISVLEIAPNPTNNATQVQFIASSAARVNMDLIQMDGAVVMNLFNGDVHPGMIYTQNLLMSEFDAGMYQIRWSTASGVLTKKVLLIH